MSKESNHIIFNKRKVEFRHIGNKKIGGNITRVFSKSVIANNVLIVACYDGVILRGTCNPESPFDEIELVRKGSEDSIQKLFLSNDGQHLVVCMKSGENFYLHQSSLRASKLSKLNGTIESISFTKPLGNEDKFKFSFLVGTSTGKIYEFVVDQSGKEKFCQLIYQLESQLSITYLYAHALMMNGAEPKLFLFFATPCPMRIYYFFGSSSYQNMFGDSARNASYTEFPGDQLQRVELHCVNKLDIDRTLQFSVLTKNGIYSGSFSLQNEIKSAEDIIVEAKLIPFPMGSALPGLPEPIATVATSYHFLTLRKDRMLIVSNISGDVVQEVIVKREIDGSACNLVRDPVTNSIWLQSDTSLFTIDVDKEDRYVWQIYLRKAVGGDEKCFNLALLHLGEFSDKSQVIKEQALYYLRRHQYDRAAQCIVKAEIRFDIAALNLIQFRSKGDAGASNFTSLNSVALQIYLTELLKSLPASAKSQKTMICTWLTELYLHQISTQLLGINAHIATSDDDVKIDYVVEFKSFLRVNKQYLDQSTTFSLINSRNLREISLFYSQIVGDYERVINYHLGQGRHGEIINIFNDAPFEKVEKFIYKISPILIEFEPEFTVQMLLDKPKLKISNILPAIIQYCTVLDNMSTSNTESAFPIDVDYNGNKCNFAVKYLQEYLAMIESEHDENIFEANIIHSLVSLLAKYDESDEGVLEGLLYRIHNKLLDGHVIQGLDKEYLLRICKRWKRNKSMIVVYMILQMYDKAVLKAIEVDIELAIGIARQHQIKEYWLHIAKYLIKRDHDAKSSLNLMHDSGGMLQIEDLLPYLPDFTEVDYFKNEICLTLEESSETIEHLKAEMNDLSESAEAIVRELESMKKRGFSSSTSQRCDYCSEFLFGKQFYLFPCSHGFHCECLSAKVSKYLDSSQLSTLRSLEDQLKQLLARKDAMDKKKMTQIEYLQGEIDGYIAADCPLCGHMMIQSICVPLITEEDKSEADTWAL